MDREKDTRIYNMAVNQLKFTPTKGPEGTYHVKNGEVYVGYNIIPVTGFSKSQHAWNILH
jgi:hypothetical protein